MSDPLASIDFTRWGPLKILIGVAAFMTLIAMMAPNEWTTGLATNLIASVVLFWAVDMTIREIEKRRLAPAQAVAWRRARTVLSSLEHMATSAFFARAQRGEVTLASLQSWSQDDLPLELTNIIGGLPLTADSFSTLPTGRHLTIQQDFEQMRAELLERLRLADLAMVNQDPAVIHALSAVEQMSILAEIRFIGSGVAPATGYVIESWRGLIETYRALQAALNAARPSGEPPVAPRTFFPLMSQSGIYRAA